MKVRKFDHMADYETLCMWWKQHEWLPVPVQCLPMTGFIVDGLAAGFLYKTDSNIAWLEWVVANKESDKEERSKAIDLVVDELILRAKELGYTRIFTSTNNPKLEARYHKHGFGSFDKNVTQMIWGT